MKKILALIMLLCLFACAALAEADTEADTEMNWSEMEDFIDVMGIKGDFVTFDEIAMKLWVPDSLAPMELTEEDAEDGIIGYYANEDESAYVLVTYVNAEGMSLEDFAEWLKGEEDVSGVEPLTVNGLPCLSYDVSENDSSCLVFATEAGNLLEVTVSPTSSEEYEFTWAIVLSSIQPE